MTARNRTILFVLLAIAAQVQLQGQLVGATTLSTRTTLRNGNDRRAYAMDCSSSSSSIKRAQEFADTADSGCTPTKRRRGASESLLPLDSLPFHVVGAHLDNGSLLALARTSRTMRGNVRSYAPAMLDAQHRARRALPEACGERFARAVLQHRYAKVSSVPLLVDDRSEYGPCFTRRCASAVADLCQLDSHRPDAMQLPFHLVIERVSTLELVAERMRACHGTIVDLLLRDDEEGSEFDTSDGLLDASTVQLVIRVLHDNDGNDVKGNEGHLHESDGDPPRKSSTSGLVIATLRMRSYRIPAQLLGELVDALLAANQRHLASSGHGGIALGELDLALDDTEGEGQGTMIPSLLAVHLARLLAANTALHTLILDFNALDGAATTLLANTILKHNTHLRTLSLSLNSIGAAGFHALSEVLRSGKTALRTLDVSGNDGGLVGNELLPLISGVTQSRTLRVLDLSENGLTVEEARAVETMLRWNTVLRELKLSSNEIRHTAVKHIARGLAVNSRLVHLALDDNGLDAKCATLIANALLSNRRLRSLDLSFNAIDDEGAQSFASVLLVLKSRLRELDLSSNHITERGARAIERALLIRAQAGMPAVRVVLCDNDALPERLQLGCYSGSGDASSISNVAIVKRTYK